MSQIEADKKFDGLKGYITKEILGTVGQGKIRIGNVCLDIESELDQERAGTH